MDKLRHRRRDRLVMPRGGDRRGRPRATASRCVRAPLCGPRAGHHRGAAGDPPAGAGDPGRKAASAVRLAFRAGRRPAQRFRPRRRSTSTSCSLPATRPHWPRSPAPSPPSGSPIRGRYLRPGQFAARFGATSSAVATVTATLRREGLHPGRVSGNGLSHPRAGTAAALARAFATGFRQYRLRDDRTVFANTSAPLVGASAAPDVQAVVGLDDVAVPVPALSPAAAAPLTSEGPRCHPSGGGRAGPEGGEGGPQACSTARDQGSKRGRRDYRPGGRGLRVPRPVLGAGDLGSGTTVALFELQGYGTEDICAPTSRATAPTPR